MAESKKKLNEVIKPVENKPKRTRPDQQTHLAPGDNTKYLSHALEVGNLPAVDHNVPAEVEKRCIEYFELCAKNDMKPSMAGLGLAFGVTRKSIWCWINKVDSVHMPDECRHILEKAVAMLNAQMEDYMQNGKINPASGIFLMKNNFGYVDEVKQVVEHKNLLGAEGNEDELRRKYQDNVIDVDFIPKEDEENLKN